MTETSRRKRQYVLLPTRGRAGEASSAEPDATEREVAIHAPDDLARAVLGRSRHELIAEAAYYRSLARGRRAGDPHRDWLEAERDIDELLRRTRLD